MMLYRHTVSSAEHVVKILLCTSSKNEFVLA